jgi:hypothetical protein
VTRGSTSIPLCFPRSGHTATLLDDGRVLVAGGSKPITPERAAFCDFDDPCSLQSAEVVDPSARSSTLVAPMRVPREAHGAAAVVGGVLVCGGFFSGGGCLRTPGSVERFDVATGAWSRLPAVPGLIAPSTTLLASGEVLLAGGLGTERLSASALTWEPVDAAWRARADLPGPRYLHAAELLGDGRVLVAGGLGETADRALFALSSAALYDSRTDTWTDAAPLHHARAEHTLTRLGDGSVLAVGGYGDEPAIHASAELYQPETGAWIEVGPMQRARTSHTATALVDGGVLIVGGTGGTLDATSPPWSEAELFDPRARTFQVARSLTPRAGHTATRLGDGRVLVAGGGPQTAEIWS